MASDQPAAPAEIAPAVPKKMSRRRQRKLIIAVVAIAAALIVILWGWSSTGRSFLGVGSLVDESNTTNPAAVPAKYAGKEIEIQGNVDAWYGGTDFVLVDKIDPAKSIDVHMAGTFPEGFQIGKTVVVKGTLETALPLTIQATEIAIGCASKY